MKNIKYTIALFLILISVVACVRKVVIDIPYEGDRITMYSYITQDSNVYARLTKSGRQIDFSGNFTTITNGNVVLLENDITVATLANTNINGANWYISNYKAKANKTYTVKAIVPNLPNAQGSDATVSKAAFKIDSFYFKPNSGMGNNTTTDFVRITIADPATENYYLLKIFKADTNTAATGPRYIINENSGSVRFIATAIAETQDPFEFLDPYGVNELYFSDAKFNGKTLAVKLDLDGYFSNGASDNKIAVILKSISKNYYMHRVSADNQNINSGNPFVEPAQIFSNIMGGYGIVATSADSVAFKRKQ